MLKTEHIVRRHSRNWDSLQNLIKQYYLFGIKVWSRIVDTEEIPGHVYIQFLCFGDWYGWQSKFYDYINAENERKKAKLKKNEINQKLH